VELQFQSLLEHTVHVLLYQQFAHVHRLSLVLQIGGLDVLLRTLVAFNMLANSVLLQTSVFVACASTQTAQSSLSQFCNVAPFYDCIFC